MLQQETEAASAEGDRPVASLGSASSQRVGKYAVRDPANRKTQRVADLLLAAALILFTLPLATVVCLAIKLESFGPVFSRRLRLGADGRLFRALKFRTTLHHADAGSPWRAGAPQTRVGRYLSYTRIEELPQLINVVRGDMGILDRSRRLADFLD
jgi:lipopolysaccharide/colanic/teichoic acid biosynthesis glycosyltransferase